MSRKLNNLDPVLQRLEPSIRREFDRAIRAGARRVDFGAVERSIREGNVQAVVDLLELPEALFAPLFEAFVAAFAAGGAMVSESARMAGARFLFNARSTLAERIARNIAGEAITNILESQRAATLDSVRGALQDGLAGGRGPRSVAIDLVGRVNRATGRREGGILGLDAPRAARLRIVQEAMRTPEGVQSLVVGGEVKYKVNAATRARILAAWRRGTAVAPADRALSARQYANKLLKERGETIARTEALSSLRAGRRAGFEQAIEAGAVPPDGLVREWDASGDSRVRPDHEAMDGETLTGMDAPWVLPDGSRMMTPGDASLGAPASQIIACRCYERFRVDWIANA